MIVHPSVTASLSRRAYDDAPDLTDLRLNVIAMLDHNGTQVMIARDYSAGILYLVFRGTEEPKDFMVDINYAKTDFPEGGRVHEGFLEAFLEVRKDIAIILREEAPTLRRVFCGHSLGAALALEAAATWRVDEVHTYGCPRTGNKDFVKLIKAPVYRFVNHADIVTKVPPLNSPYQALHALSEGRWPTLYRHAGEKRQLIGVGHRSRRYEAAAKFYGIT